MRPVETLAEQLFYSTVYIETESDAGAGTGTGFFIEYDTTGGKHSVLVTNRHVFEGAHTAHFRTVVADSHDNPTDRAFRVTVTDFNEGSVWVGHPDRNVDVAVLPFGGIRAQMIQNERPPFTRGFAPDMLLTNKQAADFDAIEDVLFIGYPNGLYDTASWLPVARSGKTATPVWNDYKGWPAFLIDASVFPGSSGSPVVLHDRGPYIDRQGNMNVGRSRFHLIGVVAAVHTREVRGEIVFTRARPIPRFEDMIDLGIVFKASAIQECVNKLMKELKVEVKEAPAAKNLA